MKHQDEPKDGRSVDELFNALIHPELCPRCNGKAFEKKSPTSKRCETCNLVIIDVP